MPDQVRTRKAIVLHELRKARGERVASWDPTVAGGGTAVHSRAAELRTEGHTIICERIEGVYYYHIVEPEQREAKRMAEARQVGLFV